MTKRIDIVMGNKNSEFHTAKKQLMATWADLMADEGADEFISSLVDQISGEADMSAEDFTEEIAKVLNWEFPMTDDQEELWEQFVNKCAREFLIRHEIETNFPQADELTIEDVIDCLADAKFESETEIANAVESYMDR